MIDALQDPRYACGVPHKSLGEKTLNLPKSMKQHNYNENKSADLVRVEKCLKSRSSYTFQRCHNLKVKEKKIHSLERND